MKQVAEAAESLTENSNVALKLKFLILKCNITIKSKEHE